MAERTGLNNDDAARRVNETVTQLNNDKEAAKHEAEAARKTAMHVSLYVSLSLLIGAFIASAAGALGGRHRDEY